MGRIAEQLVSNQQETKSSGERNALAALAMAEARLRLAMHAANIGFWEWDFREGKAYHSAEWKRQLGYRDDEIANDIGEWQTRIHPDDRQRVKLTVDSFFHSAPPRYDVEFRLRHRDGSYRWIHSVGVLFKNASGEASRILGVHVDITLTKSSELKLETERKRAAEEHARLAAIVTSSNDAIVGEDLDGLITSWNKSAERIYGYSATEVLGKPIRMLVPRERHQEVTEILEKIRRGETIEHLETPRVRKDGTQILISLVVSPIRDDSGLITGASAIARDVTKRKQLENEVLQISEREQQRIAQDLHDGLGQLLSGTAHLSTALQVELAEQALPEAAEALRITDLLHEAVSEARSLAHGLYPVRPEPNGLMVALQDLATRTCSLFKVECTLDTKEHVLLQNNAVATHLYRIAQEAISNALKHGKATRLRLRVRATSRRIVLQVRDNGAGFAHASLMRKGMGIRIMQYRAAMAGGSLVIRHLAGGGVTVVCTIPVRA